MKYNKEYQLSKSLSIYLKSQYSKILYHFDLTGLNLSKAQSGMTKVIQNGRGWPDLFIAEPRGIYHGLFIELKAETPYLKDGITLKKDVHLQEQLEIIDKLKKQGFYARFVIGFEDAKKCIDAYMEIN